MSTINVTNLSGRGGGTPNLPDGAVISGVATVTNLKPTNVNVSGAVTATTVVATTFDGSLKSTGTPTLGLGVTINASGVAISGVATAGILSATTLYGDGTNLTGVGDTVAPWYYNPDINDSAVDVDTGIGITFNKKLFAGSGTMTLKLVNVATGAGGTVQQSWGVSSCTFDANNFSAALVSDISAKKTYELSIPEGFFVDGNETSYAGTAYTFATIPPVNKLFTWGYNNYGALGLNQAHEAKISSPVQIPGVTWAQVSEGYTPSDGGNTNAAVKTDGTLWTWGVNGRGQLGVNYTTARSSPVQVPGTTWRFAVCGEEHVLATKTDGTLWTWGTNEKGVLGQNSVTPGYSSPIQIGSGTDWTDQICTGPVNSFAIKTNGTLWSWGANTYMGTLGLNQGPGQLGAASSPTQIPGTTWAKLPRGAGYWFNNAIKTDGTLWSWGYNSHGQLGVPSIGDTHQSSPVQIPGTTWTRVENGQLYPFALKTDNTLWGWGEGSRMNSGNRISSPVQIPGSWAPDSFGANGGCVYCMRPDGTFFSWGTNGKGQLGHNNLTQYSSPKQVGSGTDWNTTIGASGRMQAMQADETP